MFGATFSRASQPMKYVIVNRMGMEFATVFPEQIEHKHAVDRKEAQVMSAGFCKVGAGGRIEAYGASTSLGVGARPDDGQVIEFSLKLIGLLPAGDSKQAANGGGI